MSAGKQTFISLGDPKILANAAAFIGNLAKDKLWKITIERYVKPRSDEQNNALWGVAYPVIMAFSGLSGKRDCDEMHRDFCGDYFGWVKLPTGGQRPRRTTTTDKNGNRDALDAVAMAEFYSWVQRTLAPMGCYVPDPDPLHNNSRFERYE